MRRFLLRLANLAGGGKAERELAREIEGHLTLLQENFERRGLPPEEARLAAKREYGGIEQAKELHRAERSFVWVEQFFKDVRYGWINLLRNPGFTLVAVTALALGIGVNATIFGIYNAVALKQLPVADPGRVVRLERWFERDWRGDIQYNFAYPEYQYLREHNSVFSGLTAASFEVPVMASIGREEVAEHLAGHAVSANYFADLGVPTRIGRTFLPDEDRIPGANPVVVLSDEFWQRKFHGDPNILGQTIKLNGLAYTMIGVAPEKFTGTDVMPTRCDFWAPLSMIDQLDAAFGPMEEWRDATAHPQFEILARLKDGVAREKAQAETELLMRQYLSGYREINRTKSITLQRTAYFGNTEDPRFQASVAGVLMVVSLVLLVACANVANMLLARGAMRQREISVRMALGASRARIIGQLLTESVLLALLGGAAGLLLSVWASKLLWTSVSGIFEGFQGLRTDLDVSADGHVFLYGFALALVTGVVFGLAPALQFTKPDLNTAIKQEGAAFGARLSRSKLRGLLLGAQVAVSVLLLMTGGELISRLVSSGTSDPGFQTRDTYFLTTNGDPAKAQVTGRNLRERLEALPELSAVSMGTAPMMGTYSPWMKAGKLDRQTLASYASDGYLDALGIALLRGRSFTRQETNRGAPVAVISESTARSFWGDADALGRHFSLDLQFQNKFTDFEVIGIARDVRFANIAMIDPLHVYLPADGSQLRSAGALVFRIPGNREKAIGAVQSAVGSVDASLLPGMAIFNVEDGPLATQRNLIRVTETFAGVLTLLSLTLAGVGIYGVMSFLVSHRTREIGIRMALGATSSTVLRGVMAQGLRPVLAGTLIGFGASAALDSLIRAVVAIPGSTNLLQSTFGDLSLYVELALVLFVAALACVVPARRAMRVDPMVALRYE
ncbi:MAG TPA: ABC transporter permease [Bryobacteraceae bacterium]|jgi:putative ABC transport system permease protein